MRLKAIEHVSFRKTEATNFDEVTRKLKLKLSPHEVVCLVSLTGNQIVFVYGWSPSRKQDTKTTKQMVLRSERLRLDHGTWEPLMLGNYARKVGLHLDNIRLFEEHYAQMKGETHA